MTNHETARFRRRAEIEARQWTGSNADAMGTFCSPFDFQTIDPEDRVEDPDRTAAVRTHPHGGWVGLRPGDWVVREAGRYTTASDEEFRAAWEPVPAAVSVPPPTSESIVKCSRAVLRQPHTSHGWQPQPGMDFVSCPGASGWECPLDDEPGSVPPPAPRADDRAAVLREAADELGRMDYDTDSSDYGYDTYRDAWNGGVMDGADLLRRLAEEATPVAAPSPLANEPGPAVAAPRADDQAAVCICGHTEAQHFEDACLACDCGDFMTGEAAREVIARWRDAATRKANGADLPGRLEAVLTERFTELGNPFSAMRRQEQGPDGWPASHPVGPHHVAEVLRELLDGGPCVAGEQQNETPEAETVHGCPPDGSGLTPCCGRTPFELPRTDRISSELAAVTCPPAVVAQPGKETAAALLSSECDACEHTLNWHRNDVGCTVDGCVCGRFQTPDTREA